jgi:hypothetical protein
MSGFISGVSTALCGAAGGELRVSALGSLDLFFYGIILCGRRVLFSFEFLSSIGPFMVILGQERTCCCDNTRPSNFKNDLEREEKNAQGEYKCYQTYQQQ